MLESPFNKITGLPPCMFIEMRLKHKGFPVHIEKHMRTVASYYSFTLVICFRVSLYSYKENLLW